MDVAFYHDDPASRLAPYDPQSSPGSVDSASSTDVGPICAIAAVPPAYRDQRFGADLKKAALLKGMNLQLQTGNTAYSSSQQFIYNPAASVESREGYHQPNGFEQVSVSSSVNSTSASSFSLNIPEEGISTSSSLSTPEVVNMLKVGSTDIDQMLMQYSQTGSPVTPQVYSRNTIQEQEELFYARELARQKAQGGSTPDLVRANENTAIASGASLLSHPHQYMTPESSYASHDGHQSNLYGTAAGSTVHYMGNPALLQAANSGIMSPHSSLLNPSVKEELPQTVPVLPNRTMSPIDMEQQELIKTERKRMRNRLAASKCRKRKLERISRLEEKVNGLKNQNLELSTNANLLRQQVAELKSKVMAHVNSGCQLMMSQQQQQVAF